MNTKSFFLSKTFWVQIVAMGSMLFPAVRQWVESNPVDFAAAWAALNILVRFVTHGKISLVGEPAERGAGTKVPAVLLLIAAGGLLAVALPSCALPDGTPVRFSLIVPDGAVSYSSKGGLEIAVERSTK